MRLRLWHVAHLFVRLLHTRTLWEQLITAQMDSPPSLTRTSAIKQPVICRTLTKRQRTTTMAKQSAMVVNAVRKICKVLDAITSL